jgi:prepilin-type N-terminal cleavage/methylation domain-containing protein
MSPCADRHLLDNRVVLPLRGFSLIELVIVIVIIGIIAAIAIPRMSHASENARYAATHGSFATIERAVLLYHAQHRELPGDKGPGQMPDGLEDYLNPDIMSARPCIGGQWDWDGPPEVPESIGVSIRATPNRYEVWEAFDARIDNGDNLTGLYVWDDHRLVRLVVP